MDSEKYKNLLHLRTILHSMERDLGLDGLSKVELDVLLVARSLTKKLGDVVTSHDIRHHTMIEPIAQATFHRALRSLVDRGFMRNADGTKSKAYVVQND